MADIAPLKPLRYDLAKLASSGGLASVVAPPYDVISPEQRMELVRRRERGPCLPRQRGCRHPHGP